MAVFATWPVVERTMNPALKSIFQEVPAFTANRVPVQRQTLQFRIANREHQLYPCVVNLAVD
jgi:hypothetical protein